MSKRDKIKQPRKPFLERFPFTWFPFTLLRGVLLFLKDVYRLLRTQVKRSIRMQLVLTFGVCFLASLAFYGISEEIFGEFSEDTVIDYSSGIERIDRDTRNLVDMLEPRYHYRDSDDNDQDNVEDGAKSPVNSPGSAAPNGAGASAASQSTPAPAPVPGVDAVKESLRKQQEQQQTTAKQNFQNTVKRLANNEKYKIVVTDLEGKAVFRSENAPETYIDVHNVIRNAMNLRKDDEQRSRTEFSSFYPVNYDNHKSYLIVSGIPQPSIHKVKRESPLSALTSFALFIFLFYYITQKKMRYIEELAGSLRIISTGNLSHRVSVRSEDELGSLARDMNFMVGDLERRIEEERHAERLKNELITNISHDLRTPLTLIMGYLRLLHDKNYESSEQASGYLSIAFGKAEKLKGLIDDLFEYTKLSNQDVPLHKRGVIINEVLDQLLEEYVTISEEQQLTLIRSLPSERLTVKIDVDKMIRVFENLLSNAIKYSPKPGTISVSMARSQEFVIIRVSNKADPLADEELEQLFDRFYRTDPSRSSATGGSGLGLAIARSIVESHDGSIWAESNNADIHFYVKLKLVP